MAIDKIDVTKGITGILPVANGGTGASSFSSGKIGQVITATHATESNNNSSSYATTGLTANITPSATSSKIFISYQVPMYQDGNGGSIVSALHAIYKGGSSLQEFGAGWGMTNRSINFAYQCVGVYLDSPSSTSSLTYAVYYRPYDTGEGQIIYACPDSNSGGMFADSTASLVLMEVLA
jgi:hypothetical protein